jgi:hypothetical protein
MLRGNLTPEQFARTFQTEIPFVPLGFRTGLAAAIRGLQGELNARQDALYQNLADWK